MPPSRKVFYSFHYARDSWRVQAVKNMGVVEGQPLMTSNQWEEVKKKGPDEIKKWIDAQMSGKSCLIVLIGKETAGRRWVKYEIKEAWEAGKGVVGVNIHRLQDQNNRTDTRGPNPFSDLSLDGSALSGIVKRHEPSGPTSNDVYASIKAELPSWVEEAITIRKNYST